MWVLKVLKESTNSNPTLTHSYPYLYFIDEEPKGLK